jgi:hypothetical protein
MQLLNEGYENDHNTLPTANISCHFKFLQFPLVSFFLGGAGDALCMLGMGSHWTTALDLSRQVFFTVFLLNVEYTHCPHFSFGWCASLDF